MSARANGEDAPFNARTSLETSNDAETALQNAVMQDAPLRLPVTPPPPPNWTAIAAIVISILSLIKTFWSDWRGRRSGKFDKNFGEPIRSGLRVYAKELHSLRGFLLSDPRPEQDKKLEIASLRGGWIEAGYEMTRLLQEADDNGKLLSSGWAADFTASVEQAEEIFIRMTDPMTTSEDMRRLAKQAQEAADVAIARVRTDLNSEEESYDKFFGRAFRR